MSSAWLESYGDVSRWDFSTTRPINMDGFVHIAEGFAKNCAATTHARANSLTPPASAPWATTTRIS